MALLNNKCNYFNCNRIYSNLNDLIIHIEQEHIDFSNERLQQLDDEKADCLPLSYILKYNNNNELPSPISLNDNINEHSYSSSNEPVIIDTFGHADFNRLTDKIFNELISPIKSEKLNKNGDHNNNKSKKPFVCNMPGCYKSYKNKNGIIYHCKNYHKCKNPTVAQSILKFNNLLKLPPPPTTLTPSSSSSLDEPKVKVESAYDLDDFSFTNIIAQNKNNDMIYSNFQRYTSIFDNNQVPLNNQSFNYQIDDE